MLDLPLPLLSLSYISLFVLASDGLVDRLISLSSIIFCNQTDPKGAVSCSITCSTVGYTCVCVCVSVCVVCLVIALLEALPANTISFRQTKALFWMSHVYCSCWHCFYDRMTNEYTPVCVCVRVYGINTIKNNSNWQHPKILAKRNLWFEMSVVCLWMKGNWRTLASIRILQTFREAFSERVLYCIAKIN